MKTQQQKDIDAMFNTLIDNLALMLSTTRETFNKYELVIEYGCLEKDMNSVALFIGNLEACILWSGKPAGEVQPPIDNTREEMFRINHETASNGLDTAINTRIIGAVSNILKFKILNIDPDTTVTLNEFVSSTLTSIDEALLKRDGLTKLCFLLRDNVKAT